MASTPLAGGEIGYPYDSQDIAFGFGNHAFSNTFLLIANGFLIGEPLLAAEALLGN
ncbi:MAG: hypothetical protein GY768_07860 [Planctomycetaceae bacterium]|nr:hypothetical protein [Planctomycetaceae bacterium]